MLSAETAGLVGAVAGGLVGGLAVRRRERTELTELRGQVAKLEPLVAQLEQRCAGLVALQRADAMATAPLLTWPELGTESPAAVAGIVIV